MATKVLGNAAFAGAVAAFSDGRAYGNSNPAIAPATTIELAAAAFKTQFLTANAALAVPMTDADNTEIGYVCYAAAYGVLAGRPQESTTAANYAQPAAAAAANAKAALAGLA